MHMTHEGLWVMIGGFEKYKDFNYVFLGLGKTYLIHISVYIVLCIAHPICVCMSMIG